MFRPVITLTDQLSQSEGCGKTEASGWDRNKPVNFGSRNSAQTSCVALGSFSPELSFLSCKVVMSLSTSWG